MSSERGIAAPLLLGAAVLVAIGLAGLYVTLNSDEDPPPNGDAGGYELRAIGDSVTAGWGHFPRGRRVPAAALILGRCIPPPLPNGRCQSPRKVAYPAVYAARAGIPLGRPAFDNLAVAGADPIDWLEGPFADELESVVADDPDLTVLTLGANPLLTDFIDFTDRRGGACIRGPRPRDCIEAALRQFQVVARLSRVYQRLLDTPADGKRGSVVVFQYHRTQPATVPPDRVEILFEELRAAISRAVADARERRPQDAGRLLLVETPSFEGHHCGDPDPWVLSADTCIHPSAAGHEQFARALEQAVPRPALDG